MKVLFATSNEAKISIYKNAFDNLDVEVLTINDLEEKLEVEESGFDPVENAKIKAKAYYDKYKIVTLAADDGLFVDKFNIEEQPGNEIKRFTKEKVTDEVILDHYSKLLDKYDGESEARVIKGAAIYDGQNYFIFESENKRKLISKPSKTILKGYPLSSLTYYDELGKYLSELNEDEIKEVRINEEEGIHEFVKNAVDQILFIKDNEKIFLEYIKEYDKNNPLIALKEHHSIRVARVALYLATSLNFSEYDKRLAYIIGLMHDIGRFYQVKKHDTFNDHISLDHGELGAKYLIVHEKIKMFDVKEEDYSVVYKAVDNHNKYEIEDNLTERELLFSKLIRDADKIDIMFQASYRDDLLYETDEEITPKVLEDFYITKKIRTNEIKNDADRNFRFFVFVHDINFDVSKKYLLESKYVSDIYNKLNNKMYEKIYNETISFLKR